MDEDALLEDFADDLMNGDPDEAISRAEKLGYRRQFITLKKLIHSVHIYNPLV